MKTKVLFVMALGLLGLSSCKKEPEEGCTDSDANNYSSSAEKDDGSCTYNYGCMDENALNFDNNAFYDDGTCTYPTKAKISFVEINSFPNVDSNGDPWDASDNPDIFVRIENNSGTVLFQGDTWENLGIGHANWIIDPSITITDFDNYISLLLYDEDVPSDQFMGLSTVNLGSYTSTGSQSEKYPSSIETTYSGYTFTISVQWE